MILGFDKEKTKFVLHHVDSSDINRQNHCYFSAFAILYIELVWVPDSSWIFKSGGQEQQFADRSCWWRTGNAITVNKLLVA